jgi:hypothetical protein
MINGMVTMADIVLYQFFEFTVDCYGIDVTELHLDSQGEVKDVYGRLVVYAFPKLKEFSS